MGKKDYCCAVGCSHDRKRGATCFFYSFPVDKAWRDTWEAAVKREVILPNGKHVPWTASVGSRLCSCHFAEPPSPSSRAPGNKNVKPTIFAHKPTSTPRSTVRSRDRPPPPPPKRSKCKKETAADLLMEEADQYQTEVGKIPVETSAGPILAVPSQVHQQVPVFGEIPGETADGRLLETEFIPHRAPGEFHPPLPWGDHPHQTSGELHPPPHRGDIAWNKSLRPRMREVGNQQAANVRTRRPAAELLVGEIPGETSAGPILAVPSQVHQQVPVVAMRDHDYMRDRQQAGQRVLHQIIGTAVDAVTASNSANAIGSSASASVSSNPSISSVSIDTASSSANPPASFISENTLSELDIADFREAKAKAELWDKYNDTGRILSLENCKNNEKQFKYYTGLPSYAIFKALFEYFEEDASSMKFKDGQRGEGSRHYSECCVFKPGPKHRKLSLEEQFFCTLVRLRRGTAVHDLALRMGVSDSTISNIFQTWTALLAKGLEMLCSSPSTDKVLSKKAKCFKDFGNLAIIIDCTELFSETPSNLGAHKQLFSNYKHHSTVKFLVGISPAGAIIYISKMYGGRASDVFITEESTDFLDWLEPGTGVMADRGFTIDKLLPPGVKLIIPPFKPKNSCQFSPAQVQSAKHISEGRVHVERAMAKIKDWEILSQSVKIAMIDNYENIFKSCAYLVNFQNPFLKV